MESKTATILRYSLEEISNNTLRGTYWLQASLPICTGGLGIRNASNLSLPAFFTSGHGAQTQIFNICRPIFSKIRANTCQKGKKYGAQFLHRQHQTKIFDKKCFLSLDQDNNSPFHKARFKSAAKKKSEQAVRLSASDSPFLQKLKHIGERFG